MAMNGDLLGTQIAVAIGSLTSNQKSDVAEIWKTIAGLIVSHIQSQGVVTTAGTAAAQTGTIA